MGERMRYLMLVSATKEYEAGQQPDPGLVAAMVNLISDLVKSGKLIDTAGLLPTSHATRIRVATVNSQSPMVHSPRLKSRLVAMPCSISQGKKRP